MVKIVILTGSELRHEYFRKKIASNKRISVLASYCEGLEESLESRTHARAMSSWLEQQHVEARHQSEIDFFSDYVSSVNDRSNPHFITKGAINSPSIVKEINNLNPDLLVCYGSSLIQSELVFNFRNRFINVHLGLSPYYRGSGTNVWPLINGEPEMVGATFMYLDAGIDTGEIIHQIEADFVLGDNPHTIGNRLIRKMTVAYTEIILEFGNLKKMDQPKVRGRLYRRAEFDSEACYKLYQNFSEGIIEDFLLLKKSRPFLVKNKGLT